jgi:hypothetical protein
MKLQGSSAVYRAIAVTDEAAIQAGVTQSGLLLCL